MRWTLDLDMVDVGGHAVAVPDEEYLVALAAALPRLLGRPVEDHRSAVESCAAQQVQRVSGVGLQQRLVQAVEVAGRYLPR